MASAAREGNSHIFPKETNKNQNTKKNINQPRLYSDKQITNVSIASNKTSMTYNHNNLIVKPKAKDFSGNLTTNFRLKTNPNEKEKNSISVYYNNNENFENKYFEGNNTNGNNNIINNNGKNKRNSSTKQLNNLTSRRDAKGTPIIKGRKKHQITYKDYLDSKAKLVEVVKIESFKEYNAQDTDSIKQNKNSQDDNTSCACSIF